MNRSTKESAGALGGRERFADPHAPHPLPERVAADRVPIAEKVRRRGPPAKASPICWAVQGAVGCSVTLKWRTRRRWWARNVRQVWDGGVCRMLGLEFLAVRSPLF